MIILECSLSEFYNGCLKKIEFERELLTHDGKTTKSNKEEMHVEVKPGFSESTVLSYPSKGSEAHSHRPSKLVVKFKQLPHENYKRNGNDLIYTHKISLE